MSRHEKCAVGLWTTTNDPESFGGNDFFDTREEAVAEAAEIGDGWVAKVDEMSDPEWAAEWALDLLFPDGLDGHIRCQDEWSWREDEIVASPKPEAAEELRVLLTDWFKRHNLVDEVFSASTERL